ncbi:MAG: SCO family protein [bacterium]|nr:SCO family protein [bacterium]
MKPVRHFPFGRGAVPLLLVLTWLGGAVLSAAQELPKFQLHNWDGGAVSNDSLEGATTIVAFTYAKCVFACPMITFQLRDLDRKLDSPPGIRYLHISVNPAEDTAEEILLHFGKHKIDPREDQRWMFVNGPPDGLAEMLAELGIEVRRIPVEGGYLIKHTILVLVVGPDGTTLESFETYNWDQEELLSVLHTASALG